MMDERVCAMCESSGARLTLERCPICFKLVCENCVVARSGRRFCSIGCGDYFFFDDDE